MAIHITRQVIQFSGHVVFFKDVHNIVTEQVMPTEVDFKVLILAIEEKPTPALVMQVMSIGP